MNKCWFFVMAAGGVLWAGCQATSTSPSTRAATVIIKGYSSAAIKAATQSVFEGAGYESGQSDDDDQVFQRKGSFMNSFTYGEWYGGAVWERTKIYQHQLENGLTEVDCDRYMVQDHEDPLFQKERKMSGRNRHCQALLDQIPKQLANAPP